MVQSDKWLIVTQEKRERERKSETTLSTRITHKIFPTTVNIKQTFKTTPVIVDRVSETVEV